MVFLYSNVRELPMIAAFRKTFFTFLVAGMATGVAAYAQSGGATLQGTVTDPTGAAVPDAQIQITAQLTGVTRDVVTNRDGFYSAPNLSAAGYQVTASAQGFGKSVLNDVVLTVGSVRDLDISWAVPAA